MAFLLPELWIIQAKPLAGERLKRMRKHVAL